MTRLMVAMGFMALASGAWAQNDAAVQKAAYADAETGTPAAAAPANTEEIDNLKGKVEGLNESYLETKTTVDKLAKIKVSGYIQPQWQFADSAVAHNNVVGGGWNVGGNNQRFQVRRGRLKSTYETATSRYVLQIDVIPTGVTLKDAYITLMEPWLKTFSYTMGVFDRPFGFEIGYSSSSRESPERSRVFQTLFPGERDLGAKLEINPPADMGFAQYLNAKAGLFTGMGPTANEIDKEQDFIGRVGFQAPIYDLNLALDGGFSAYLGKAVAANDTVFNMGKDSVSKLIPTTGQRLEIFDRNVLGVDGQLYYDLPVIGGLSLRGEYLWGEMPGTRSASGPYLASTAALVNREVAGWYVTWVQNLGKSVQTVVKYDVYDPNTEVDGSDVGKAGSNLNATDLAFNTLGLGLLYHWDENTRLTLYYDMITNEEAASTATGNLSPWKDDIDDNVFTFRVQVKF